MELTNEMILKDIAGFRMRIGEAETKISNLPAMPPGWKDRQKLRPQKKRLEDEIRHVNNLIAIAQGALVI